MGEFNETRKFGIRPVGPLENIQTQVSKFETVVCGVTRTIIAKSDEFNNTTAILHTVTAGKTFYLCYANLTANSGVNKISHLMVRNASDVDQFTILDLASAQVSALSLIVNFNPPMPIAAGFDVFVTTTNTHAASFIYGWEEDE